MKPADFEVLPIFTNFIFIVEINTEFLCLWSEITLTKRLTLPELVKIRKIENILLLPEPHEHPFSIGRRVAVEATTDIAIITMPKNSHLVQFQFGSVKLK